MSIVNFSKHQPMDTLVHIALYRHPNGSYKLSVVDATEEFLDEFDTPEETKIAIVEFAKKATWVSLDV